MSRVVLDAGAFIAFERGDGRTRARLLAARRLGLELITTSPVVAQVWRDGRRQALMARLVAATRIEGADAGAARRAGELLARAKTTEVVDALLVELVRAGDSILTSDPGDVARLLAAARKAATVIAV
jgi:hypothetical protein